MDPQIYHFPYLYNIKAKRGKIFWKHSSILPNGSQILCTLASSVCQESNRQHECETVRHAFFHYSLHHTPCFAIAITITITITFFSFSPSSSSPPHPSQQPLQPITRQILPLRRNKGRPRRLRRGSSGAVVAGIRVSPPHPASPCQELLG